MKKRLVKFKKVNYHRGKHYCCVCGKGIGRGSMNEMCKSCSNRQKQIGKRHSKTTKERMSIAKKGIKPKNLGINFGLSGSKNVNWKGGITSQNHKERTSSEMKLWRKSVFERDNFTCQKYNVKGGDLVAHHINNFADFPELRTSIANGITLSQKAHREFHKKYGIKNNSREQLLEFLIK